ncbi:hypothetical protein HH308_06325 [Gordonia sp. TBRC 11910]|uniref:Uncharacterized protein n=1 Tax=Gordonia asplenii TaxID=2725283 RepID=A0A848KZF2_9ACTN|nr:hypothetical protein [Gordonia asplenii]NMO00828.1 hypothetical protein [Gordonia asplenii]
MTAPARQGARPCWLVNRTFSGPLTRQSTQLGTYTTLPDAMDAWRKLVDVHAQPIEYREHIDPHDPDGMVAWADWGDYERSGFDVMYQPFW